jgi:hypothetical protein
MCPTSPEHSEDREDSRRRNFGWHSVFSKGVGLIWRRTLRPRGLFFPSEKLTTPLSLDNLWRRYMLPKLEDAGLEWPTFQVLRKTNASLSKKAGVDPKVASDQRGHGLGVSLEVYTSSDMEQKRAAVRKLEAVVLRKPQPENGSAQTNPA